jgi:hypothetical protein
VKFDPEFFTSTAGQWVLLALAVVLGTGAVLWQHQRRQSPLPAAPADRPVSNLPQVFERKGARFPEVETQAEKRTRAVPAPPVDDPTKTPPGERAPRLPLTLFASPSTAPVQPALIAPYGRLIPCETVVTLESNRLTTPVIGLVTSDVWEDGKVLVPAGTEVHGRASLDRTRERIAVEGSWVLVWRSRDKTNGTQLSVAGLALHRDDDSVDGSDGSAGLRGTVLRTNDYRELRLFAATFLTAATAALQDTRASVGILGESTIPAATARNATLAGTSAVLHDYADQIREAIARDGFFLRVPAGTPFYLYVTERLDLGQAQRPARNPDLP